MIDFTPLTNRLDWALDHLETLDRAAKRFLDTKPYTIEAERNPDTGAYVWRVAVREQPPECLSFIAGDCIHNIRAPLDNLTWALAAGSPDDIRRRVAFVIAATDADFRADLMQRRLKPLPSAVQTVIAGLQPFAAGQLPGIRRYRLIGPAGETLDVEDPYARTDERGRAEAHPLWVLDRLWNDDKHRAPTILGAFSESSHIDYRGVSVPPGLGYEHQLFVGVLHDGKEIASFTPNGWRNDGEVKLDPVFEVAIDKPGEGFKGPVVRLLRELHDHVRDKVLPKFSEF